MTEAQYEQFSARLDQAFGDSVAIDALMDEAEQLPETDRRTDFIRACLYLRNMKPPADMGR